MHNPQTVQFCTFLRIDCRARVSSAEPRRQRSAEHPPETLEKIALRTKLTSAGRHSSNTIEGGGVYLVAAVFGKANGSNEDEKQFQSPRLPFNDWKGEADAVSPRGRHGLWPRRPLSAKIVTIHSSWLCEKTRPFPSASRVRASLF